MRQIKFRGKEIDYNFWVEGNLLITDDNHNNPFRTHPITKYYQIVKYEAGDWNMGGWTYCNIVPETIGQFTGMFDEDNKEIYEGDIVEGISDNIFSKGDVNKYEIIWGVDHWHVKGTGFTLQELFNFCNKKVKVVGNIHEK